MAFSPSCTRRLGVMVLAVLNPVGAEPQTTNTYVVERSGESDRVDWLVFHILIRLRFLSYATSSTSGIVIPTP
jgi:hypothetical protein